MYCMINTGITLTPLLPPQNYLFLVCKIKFSITQSQKTHQAAWIKSGIITPLVAFLSANKGQCRKKITCAATILLVLGFQKLTLLEIYS